MDALGGSGNKGPRVGGGAVGKRRVRARGRSRDAGPEATRGSPREGELSREEQGSGDRGWDGLRSTGRVDAKTKGRGGQEDRRGVGRGAKETYK